MAAAIPASSGLTILVSLYSGSPVTAGPALEPILAADIGSARKVAQASAKNLLGSDAAQTAEVNQWLDALCAGFDAGILMTQLDSVLATRTYAAGYSVTLADAAIYVALRGTAAGAENTNVTRWRGLCEAVFPVTAAEKIAASVSLSSSSSADASVPVAKGATAPAEGGAAKAKAAKGGEATTTAAAASATKGGAKGGAGASNGGNPSSKNVGGGGDSGSMPALEGAEMGKVVTRFPPEPSGFLHIGHVKAVLLNDFYARTYKGRLIIRFDDTNPSKEKEEFEQNIIQDLASLGVTGDFVSHTSDYFDLLTEYARNMIRDGKAFLDDTLQDKMREERSNRIDSVHRNDSIEDNLKRFEAMIGGGEEGSKWCMRAKINMQSDNGTLRDPVMFRTNDTPHHRTGTKYKAYPTYDFACPIVDSIEGVTHALRTNEYHDRDAQYAWIQEALGIRKVIIHEFSRLNFIYTLLSKRKLTWFVENKYVEGWFDPRFPTVQGIIRRGCVLPALREFILACGASKRVLDMEWDKFWATNKRHIDPTAKRFTCVNVPDRVQVNLSGPGTPTVPEIRSAAVHPKIAELGTKAVYYASTLWMDGEDARSVKEGEEVTLMKWGNAIIRKINRGADGTTITSLDAELHLEGDYKKTEKKLTWLSDLSSLAAEGESMVPLILQDFDYLITVPKLEEGDDFNAAINSVTKIESRAVGEPAMRTAQAGDIIQLERRGFYRVDQPYVSEDKPMLLFAIPDGRVKPWGVGSAAFLAAAAAAKPATTSSNAAGAGAGKPASGPSKK